MSEDVERVAFDAAEDALATRCATNEDHAYGGCDCPGDVTLRVILRAAIVAMTPAVEIEWGWGNYMSINKTGDRAEAERQVEQWNDRAATLSREANGQASYPLTHLYTRTPLVPAGKWESGR